MKKIFAAGLLFMTLSCTGTNQQTQNNATMENNVEKIGQIANAGYVYDSFTTPKGREVSIAFIKHGSLILDADGYLIYIDPVTIYGDDYSKLPKADLIMVTHEHHDHLDKNAIEELTGDETKLAASRRVTELLGEGKPLEPGDTFSPEGTGIEITAVPAYNVTPDHLQFHPKERKDTGFIFDIDGLRIYVAGDTENIPEMADFKDIDIAFLPVNQPYTMTPEQAIEATEVIKPKILYPYHFGETDLTPIVEKFKGSETEVRLRNLE